MGNVSNRLAKLEADPDSSYIVQQDGSYYWYRPKELYKSFMLYYLDCLGKEARGEPRSPVPEIFIAIQNAQDREAAMSQVSPRWREWKTDYSLEVVLDLHRLVEDGEIVPFSWVEFVRENSPEGEDDES